MSENLAEIIRAILQEALSTDQEHSEFVESLTHRLNEAYIKWYTPAFAEAIAELIKEMRKDESEGNG